jgi:hypothetical protein
MSFEVDPISWTAVGMWPFQPGKKDRYENKASATVPASNNRHSEFLRTFPTVIGLSIVRFKTGSVVKSGPYFE